MRKYKSSILLALFTSISLIFPLSITESDEVKFFRKATQYSPAWGSKTISYIHTPKLIEYYRTYSPHGLAFQSIWVVANVTDREGRKYNLLRECKTNDSTLAIGSQEMLGLDSNAVTIFNPGELFFGRIFYEMDEKNGLIYMKPFPVGEAFSIEVRPQQVAWRDANGQIDLKFKAFGPALEYYCPGQLEDDVYRSEPCWVEGMMKGKEVSGFGVIDMAWGPVGHGFLQSKIYNLLEENWIIWLNIYEDGSKECGIYVDGVDRFEACYYNKDGKARITQNNKLDVTYTTDGFIKGATIKMDELAFQFTSESRITQIASWVSWASGRMVNLNDPRKPVKTFAWFEFFPKAKGK